MAVQTNNPATWRLRTSGGLPYKFVSQSGNFDHEKGSITWKALFRSVDLNALLVEMFPPPLIIGNVSIPQGGFMPGFPSMIAQEVDFESQDGEMPIDPWGADLLAPAGTYHGLVMVSVKFGPANNQEVDEEDPRTFLEITSKASGDFIHAPQEGAKIAEEENTASQPEDPDTGEIDEAGIQETADGKKPIRTPNLPSTILVPTTEWNITWKQIPFAHFKSVVIHRLRSVNGRVNSLSIPWLYDAAKETLLFAGFDYSESYTWRDGNIGTPPIDVTFKLIEKRVIWKNTIVGHNHVWDPGKGWRRLHVGSNSDEDPYESRDLNFLFKA